MRNLLENHKKSRFKSKITIATSAFVICFIICGATIFLYPRIGGEWASQKIIPAPPFSEVLIEETMSSDITPQGLYTPRPGLYTYQISIYYVDMPLVETRNWFSQHIPMLPLDNDLTEPATSYQSIYARLQGHNKEYLFLTAFAAITISPTFWDTSVDCFSADVFTKDAFESSIYFEQYFSNSSSQNQLSDLNENGVIAVVERCWPAG